MNGLKESLWSKYVWYNDKKELIVEETYHNGLLHGIRRVHDGMGNKIHSTIFVEGTGLYSEYYIGTKQLLLQGRLLEGGKNGTWKYYYKNGNCQKVESYENDILKGAYIVFDTDGKILYETNFIDGTGHFKSYNHFGKLEEEGEIVNGYRNGKWIEKLYYIDQYDDTEKEVELLSYYTINSPINKRVNGIIDVFYVDAIPFYIKSSIK